MKRKYPEEIERLVVIYRNKNDEEVARHYCTLCSECEIWYDCADNVKEPYMLTYPTRFGKTNPVNQVIMRAKDAQTLINHHTKLYDLFKEAVMFEIELDS